MILRPRAYQYTFRRDTYREYPYPAWSWRRIMRGFGAILWTLATVQEAMGFVAPFAATSMGGAAYSVVDTRKVSPTLTATRLRMSTGNVPKFSVSLTDDTRVSFHLEKENLKGLAQQVRQNPSGSALYSTLMY